MSLLIEPRPSRRAGASRDLLDEWEANAYAVRRHHLATAANTRFDDDLPQQPWRHIAETRAALHALSSGTVWATI
ncbi:MAG: hypothetical protein HY826_02450 [Actinobacteria bacterium]|nr:hypothetical protein [Actinomycetota bacterium]